MGCIDSQASVTPLAAGNRVQLVIVETGAKSSAGQMGLSVCEKIRNFPPDFPGLLVITEEAIGSLQFQ
jgi:hypothetical protein